MMNFIKKAWAVANGSNTLLVAMNSSCHLRLGRYQGRSVVPLNLNLGVAYAPILLCGCRSAFPLLPPSLLLGENISKS